MGVTTNTDIERILGLMALATGDEKHEPSAHSTLDVLWVLYDRVLRYDPSHPHWEGRDRFVLSKGHGPVAYYAILADRGFFPVDELRRFERWEGMLGAHPDRRQVPGAEVSTGSLGHGLPMALGMALALRAKGSAARVYVLVGDGESNEGTIWESVLLAGQQRLTNLTAIFIDNHSSTNDLGDLAEKLTAFGWAAETVSGRDHARIEAALRATDPGRASAVVAVVEPRS